MIHLTVKNLYDLAPKMHEAFRDHAYTCESRNGPVLRLPGITTVQILNPKQHVCLYAKRDANPFFHLIEALAMLSGRNSVNLLSWLASNMKNYSDDGVRFNAFYGERARVTWGDQLKAVVQELVNNPESRQAVVNLWDPADLLRRTKDKACNLCMIFSIENGRLDMTTFNRSNDSVWGFVTGANIVHLPFFQEYIAAFLDLPMGVWNHASANMHVYQKNNTFPLLTEDKLWRKNPYDYLTHCKLFSSVSDLPDFDKHLATFMDMTTAAVHQNTLDFCPLVPKSGAPYFINHVALPMFNVIALYKHIKSKGGQVPYEEIEPWIERVRATDWQEAAILWMKSRTN